MNKTTPKRRRHDPAIHVNFDGLPLTNESQFAAESYWCCHFWVDMTTNDPQSVQKLYKEVEDKDALCSTPR